MTPEQIAMMVADREAGTPGPWLYRPDQYDDWGVVKSGCFVLCQVRDPLALDKDILSEHRVSGTDPWTANARRIARVPEMEAVIIAQAAEIARLKAALTIAGPIALNDYANHPFILLDYEKEAAEVIKLGMVTLDHSDIIGEVEP
jgi:hypothetical protein